MINLKESLQSAPRIGLQRAAFPIVPLAREFPAGHIVARHRHDRGQLIFASRGVMRVDTPSGVWVVPPMRAVWAPPSVDHEIRGLGVVCLRTLLIDTAVSTALPAHCCVIHVSPLLRELILRVASLGEEVSGSRSAPYLIELIAEEICDSHVLPLKIPMPKDPRIMRICQRILQDPADDRTCTQWGFHVGATSRTLERLFHKETGMTFGSWRRQARLLAALKSLATTTPVANIASDLGYRSPAAFTAMFKRAFGCAPSEFFSSSRSPLTYSATGSLSDTRGRSEDDVPKR